MEIHPLRGRPYGGRVFVVNKRLIILKYEFINRYLAYITVSYNGIIVSIIACYFPFDNGSALNLSEFQSCLQVSLELLLFF